MSPTVQARYRLNNVVVLMKELGITPDMIMLIARLNSDLNYIEKHCPELNILEETKKTIEEVYDIAFVPAPAPTPTL